MEHPQKYISLFLGLIFTIKKYQTIYDTLLLLVCLILPSYLLDCFDIVAIDNDDDHSSSIFSSHHLASKGFLTVLVIWNFLIQHTIITNRRRMAAEEAIVAIVKETKADVVIVVADQLPEKVLQAEQAVVLDL